MSAKFERSGFIHRSLYYLCFIRCGAEISLCPYVIAVPLFANLIVNPSVIVINLLTVKYGNKYLPYY